MSGSSKPSLRSALSLLRPGHWIKNLFVLAPAFFSGAILVPDLLLRSVIAALAFSLVASAIYCINDVVDAPADRLHPLKRTRPVAAGTVSPASAITLAAVIAAAAMVLSALLVSPLLCIVLAIYLVLNIFYTLGIKRYPLIDISVIAIGFLLRLGAGSVAAQCHLSAWIVLCTFLLSLFLALGKRREDSTYASASSADSTGRQRARYSTRFIDSAMSLIGAATITCYLIYTASPTPDKSIASPYIYLTGLPVIVGVMRYLQICIDDNGGATHVKLIWRDGIMCGSIIVYILLFILLWILG